MNKKIISIILLITILVSSSCISIAAQDNTIYKDVNVYYSDEKKEESVRLMLHNNNLYVEAHYYERFGFLVGNSDNGVYIYNLQSNSLPQGAIMFFSDSTKCLRVSKHYRTEQYEAPFETVKNSNGLWIPFMYSMSILNGCILPGIDGTLVITSPCQSALDLIDYIETYKQDFEFDYADEFGYSGVKENVLEGLSGTVNRLQGLLTFDGTAWFALFTSGSCNLLGDLAYDTKYGNTMARLICTNSADELLEQTKKVSAMNDLLSEDGALGKFISEAQIKNETDLKDLSEAANDMLKKISNGTGDVNEYNRIYKQLEDTLSKASITDLGEPIVESQKALDQGVKGLKLISMIAETASYIGEFSSRDMYAVNALEKVSKALPYKDTEVSFYVKEALMSGVADFKKDAGSYSVERFMKENVVDIAFDAANVIGTKANLVLLAWSLASNFVPFLSDGIKAADNYELSIYAIAFQHEAYNLYYKKLSEYTAGGQYLTAENMRELSQYAYVYLKSCYIARDAAIGGISDKEVAEEVKEYLNEINSGILPLLALAKNTASETDVLSTGFLKEHSDNFTKRFSDQKIIDIVKGAQVVTENEYTEPVIQENDISLYYSFMSLDCEEKSSVYNEGSAFLYDMDNDGTLELVTLASYDHPTNQGMEFFGYSLYDIYDGNCVKRIDREILGYNVAGPGGRVGVGDYNGNIVFYTVYDNGETSSEDGFPKRTVEYKICDAENLDFATTVSRTYKGNSTLQVLVNNAEAKEEDFKRLTDITPIVEAEIYENDTSDGSTNFNEMLVYLLYQVR